jgi:hypothetical protein
MKAAARMDRAWAAYASRLLEVAYAQGAAEPASTEPSRPASRQP